MTKLWRAWRLGAVALVAVSAAFAPSASAAGAGAFVIRNAYTQLSHGVYYLDADMRLTLARNAVEALNNGVPLVFKIEIEITRRRAFLWDPTVADLTQSYRITYHALSRRYVVRSLNSGRQASFRSYEAAFEHLGYVNSLPVIDAALLDPDDQYDISIRAVLNVKVIPTGFGLLTSLFSGADQASDWREWPLTG
ncbi:MAG TPA: DUF4390 domain-containing protein [Gammaproteobacteria bacterium]|nr:DUF4390 domain-containing protein [Gammaproteobacteria bacterium]